MASTGSEPSSNSRSQPTSWVSVALLAATVGVVTSRGQEPAPAPPPFNHAWTMAELLPAVGDLGPARSWMAGGRVFQQAGCGICHSFSKYWEGNGLAPDLTAVSSKLTRDIILQSILEPSAEINPQYYHTEFKLKDGTLLRGSVVGAAQGTLKVAPVMMTPDVTIDVRRTEIASEGPSAVSPMPAGMLNGFTKDQIVELLAFLESRGDPEAGIYKR